MSDCVWPQRRQPTRLPRPWDSPGKNTGVGCHFLLQCMKVKSQSEVTQSCPTPSDPTDCSLPGSSVHGIFQARVLEWGAIAFSYLELLGKSEFWLNIRWYYEIIGQFLCMIMVCLLQYVFFLSTQMLKYLRMIFRGEVPCLQHTLKWFSKNKCVFVKIKQIGKLTWLKGIKKVHFTSSNFSVALKFFLEVEKPHSGIFGMTLRNIYMCVYACIHVCVYIWHLNIWLT